MKQFKSKTKYFVDELNKLEEWIKWFLLTIVTLFIIWQVFNMILTPMG